MQLKQIGDSKFSDVGYGSHSGHIKEKVYECPCSKGKVYYERDDIPGFKGTHITCNCGECDKKYTFQRGGTVVEK